jgi:D-alanyl-D-alanine endopeptidase (penicillin-binding protein 7)
MFRFAWLMVLLTAAWLGSPVQAEGRLQAATKVVRVGSTVTVSKRPVRKQRVSHARKLKKRTHAVAVVRVTRPRARVHYRVATVNADSPAALRSSAVMIFDPATQGVLFEKNSGTTLPIASLTKLMTALVVLEAKQDMNELVTVTDADVDRVKNSSSRLRVGTQLTRTAMLHIALMSSENRAASALGRNYPGGVPAFAAAMNAKAAALGMTRTRYVEPTGLSSENVSTAADLAKLVVAAQRQPLIREYSTDHGYTILQGRRATAYHNTNRLISNSTWDIGLQKTGYINEAGRCMVLHATIKGRDVVMVFLDAQGKFSRAGDANRVRAWLAAGHRSAQQ